MFAHSTLASPPEVYRANTDGTGVAQVTSINNQLVQRTGIKAAEELEWTGALGAKIQRVEE